MFDVMPAAYFALLTERAITMAQMKLMKDGYAEVDMSLPVWQESGMRLCQKYMTLCKDINLIRANYTNPPPDFNVFGYTA